MKMKRQLALFVIAALLVSLLPMGNATVSKAAAPASAAEGTARAGYGLNNPVTDSDGVTTWDCVWFGNYWQEDTNGDGKADKNDQKTPIKWRVLSVDGDDAFLLADKNLDCQKYNATYTDVTWETCTLRSWLNGYGAASNQEGMDYGSDNFLKNAFSAGQQSAIQIANVVNDDNLKYGTEGGNDTSDKVYLLSLDEVMNPGYGFSSDYSKFDENRRAKNTGYAKEQGAYTSTPTEYAGNGYWWLRSPGNSARNAAYVFSDGYARPNGRRVDRGNSGVRPALHLNLKASSDALSASSWSYAGTVTSKGEVKEEATPAPGGPVTTQEPVPQVQAPSADIPGGVYGTPQSVSLTSQTEGAEIYYTTDGTEPGVANGTRYTEPVVIRDSCTLKAVAVRDGAQTSGVMTEQYTILGSGNAVRIDGYTICVTDTSGEPVYNARVVIGTKSGTTDRDGKCEFSSIKGWENEDGSRVFNVTVQAGGYTDYAGYDCAVSENHVTYVTMRTVSEEEDGSTSLLKNRCFESVLWKDALIGNTDLMVNQKTISLSEPDKTFDLLVNVKQDTKSYVKGYSVLSGNKRVASSKDGVFEGISYSLFEADKKVYIELDIDQGSGEMKRAPKERQRINLSVKAPGESVKNSYGNLAIGDNLSFTVSEDIPFIGGTAFNLAKLDLPIDMKFSTDGSFVLSINADEDELYKTKGGILFKEFDDETLKEKKEEDVVDDTFLGCIRDALASSSENMAKGKEEKAFKAVELKFSDDFKFTAQIGGFISGKLNESCRKGTGNLYISAKAQYKGEMQTVVYSVPIVISFEVGAEGKMAATLNADFTDPSKKIGDCINGELLFHLNPYIKVGAGPGCKELNVKVKGGFELPIDYYMMGDRSGLQSIKLKANAAVSGKVFGFEKEWEFWKDEVNIYTRPDQVKYWGSAFASQTEWKKMLAAPSEPQTLWTADSLDLPDGVKTADYSDIAEHSSWNAAVLSKENGDHTLNDRVSSYTDTRTVTAGDTVMMVYSDVDPERDSYNADTLYYSLYDKDSGQWGSPVQVDGNRTADYDFDLYTDGDTIHLIYQEMNRELTSSDSTEDMAGCTRIVYAEFDAGTGKFTGFKYLAENENYVMQPTLVSNGAELTAGWIENTAKDYYALNRTNQIMARTCSGGSWSEARPLLQNSDKIMELQGCVLEGKTHLAYIIDSDNDLQTAADRNVYLRDLSGTVTTVTSDDRMNAGLVYSPVGQQSALYWYRGDTIVSIQSSGGKPKKLLGEQSINPNEDFRIISDGKENQAILFTHNDSHTENDIVEAYLMYQQADGNYSRPVQVTEENSYVSGCSGIFLGEDALINYRLDHYGNNEDTIDVSSSLHSTWIHDFSRVSLRDLDYEYDEMCQDEDLVMTVDVTNESSHEITELQAKIVDPNGKTIDTCTVPADLGIGENAALSFSIHVPEELEDGMYTLTLMESGRKDAETGSETFRLLYSELKITAEPVTLGEKLYLSAIIENRGDLATDAAVEIINNDASDKILAKVQTGKIAQEGYQLIRIPVTEDMLSEGNIYSDFTLSVKADEEERYQYDNSTMVQVASQVKSMILNPEKLEMEVKEQKELSVQIDAMGTPKFEYEWSSSDEKVAMVDQNGRVRAVSPGEAVITVMTKQGDFAECQVSVRKSAATPEKTPGSDKGGRSPSTGSQNSKSNTSHTPSKPLHAGTVFTDKKTKAVYKVMKGETTVEYRKPSSKKATKVVIPAKVRISGVTYRVDSIADKAFYKCKKLTKITIPSSIRKIGKKAFYGCKKLKKITVRTKKLTKKRVGSKAFKGIYKKAVFNVPKKKISSYRKILKSKGAGKKVKVKK